MFKAANAAVNFIRSCCRGEFIEEILKVLVFQEISNACGRMHA